MQYLESEGDSHDTRVSLECLSILRMQVLINVSPKGARKKEKSKKEKKKKGKDKVVGMASPSKAVIYELSKDSHVA